MVIKNQYKVIGDYVIIYMKHRNGDVYETYIDLDDLERVSDIQHSWYASWDKYIQGYYARISKYEGIVEGKPKYKPILLHRFIANAKKGDIVDHMNHNPLDNRKENLRITNIKNNSRHRSGKNSNNKSGYRNVSWRYNCWVVQLQVDGKNTILDKFDDVHEAGKFAEEMRKKYYGKYKGVS